MDNRQLDALVAQARGLKREVVPLGEDRAVIIYHDLPIPDGLYREYELRDWAEPDPVSADIASAMGLLEEWPGDYEIERMIGQYGVTLDRRVIATASTLPVAICLAYLKAKGVGV